MQNTHVQIVWRTVAAMLACAVLLAASPVRAGDPGSGGDNNLEASTRPHKSPPSAADAGGRLISRDHERAAAPLPPTAVIGFAGKGDAEHKLADDVTDAVAALLAAEPDVQLIDRQALLQIAREQSISPAEFTQETQAVKLGKLAGARLLIVGRVFPLDGQLMITAKVIGVETSRFEAVLVKGAPGEVDQLAMQLAEKIAERIRQRGDLLVAGPLVEDGRLEKLIEVLKTKQKPRLAVVVIEARSARQPQQAPQLQQAPAADSACETQIRQLLLDSGFTVVNINRDDLARLAPSDANDPHESSESPDARWRRNLASVDLIVTGKAFTSPRGRLGQLVAAGARAEINLIDRNNGRVLFADRTTANGIDTDEQLAGQAALAEAGKQIGMQLLDYLAQQLPDEKPEAKHKN